MILLNADYSMGTMIALVGFSTVLIVLVFLMISLNVITKLLQKKKEKEPSVADTPHPTFVESNVEAAIAVSISLFLEELHDHESGVITLNSDQMESPWGAKNIMIEKKA